MQIFGAHETMNGRKRIDELEVEDNTHKRRFPFGDPVLN
jgi:hypothetical protein